MAGSLPMSLWSRKRDLVYFVFFVIHVPIIFCRSFIYIYGVYTLYCHGIVSASLTVLTVIDAAPLLPSFLRPNVSHQLRDFYFNTYNDKFFEAPAPVWFTVFITMEVFYHAPLSIWAIGALLRGEWARPIINLIMHEL